MKFDDILLTIGEFGPYQKRIFYLMCLPPLLCGMQVFSSIFIYNIPSYRCHLPGYAHDTYHIQNEAHAQAINWSIPMSDDDVAGPYSSCEVYSNVNATWVDSRRQDGVVDSSPPQHSYTNKCTEFVYDRSEVDESVITEFDIVCDLTILRSHSFMVMFAGALFGSVFMGAISDIFGRKKTMLLTLIIHFISSLCIYLATSFNVLIGARAFNGIAIHSLFATSATTGIELVGPNKRGYTGIVVELFWSIGVMILVPIAYYVRYWRTLQLIICLAAVPLFFATFCFVPESPRWSLDKGRYKEAERVIRKVCQVNKTKLPSDALDADTIDEGPQLKIWAIFSHRALVVRYTIVFLNWFATNLIYYGLSINTGNLAGSLFVNYLISGGVEALAYAVCLPLTSFFGRKTLYCTSILTGAASCLASVFSIMFGASDWLTISLNMVGKFSGSVCYAILYLLSSELFPTVLRYSSIGVCSIFENVGGMVSSYVADLGLLVGGQVGPVLPMLVFGAVSLFSGLLSFLLPETRNQIIPETIQDAIDFNKPNRNSTYIKASQHELEELPPEAAQDTVVNHDSCPSQKNSGV